MRAVILIFLCYLMQAHPVFATPFVATVWPMKFLCDEITAKPDQCGVLLGPGLSPHTFEPKPSQMKLLREAKLLIAVGGALDPWVNDLAKQVKRVAVINLIPKEKLLPASDPHFKSAKAIDRFNYDPHFWLDPSLMQIAAGALIPVFCEAAPSQCETYRKNGARWQKDLEQLTEELSKQLTELTAVPFLIYHPFLDYFVARFQLRQVGKVEPESGHEPGPRHLREVLTSARKNGASVVVTSPQLSTRAVKVVTDAAQLKVVMMDDIGGSADRKTYQNLMRFNTQALVKGLKVKAK